MYNVILRCVCGTSCSETARSIT